MPCVVNGLPISIILSHFVQLCPAAWIPASQGNTPPSLSSFRLVRVLMTPLTLPTPPLPHIFVSLLSSHYATPP